MTDSFHGQMLPGAVFCICQVKEILPLEKFSLAFETKPSLPEMNSKAKQTGECRV